MKPALVLLGFLPALITAASSAVESDVMEEISAGIRSSTVLNNIAIRVIEYVGECPGLSVDQPRATFRSMVQPVEGRRVRIYNQTVTGEETAYTDREYEAEGNNPFLSVYGSESFKVKRVNEHTDRGLAVVWGENEMTAVVYDGGRDSFLEEENGYREVAVYDFTVAVEEETVELTRDRITSTRVECPNSRDLKDCKVHERVRVSHSYCPATANSGYRRVLGQIQPHGWRVH